MSLTSSQPTRSRRLAPRRYLDNLTRADLLAILLLVSAAAFLISIFTLRSDFYWLLAAGRSITINGLTDIDPFLTWNQGQDWLNQQWLFEILLYQNYSLFGLRAVIALYATILAATVTLAASMAQGLRLSIIGALLTIGSLIAVWDIRAAGLGILCFTIVLWLSLRPSLASGIATVAVFTLWANVHGSVIIGLVLLALLLLSSSLEQGRLARPQLWMLLAGAAASLLSPLGLDTWVYATKLGSNPALPHLTSEWRPALARPLALCYIIVFLGVTVWLMRRQSARYLILLIPFVLITLIASRNTVFLGPLSCYLFAFGQSKQTKIKFSWLGLGLIIGLGLAFTSLALARPKPQPTAHLCSALINRLPEKMSGRLAVSTGQGSYLLWRRPDLPITVDGRLEVYSASQLLNNRKITNAWPGTESRLNDYQIDNVIAYSPFAIPRLRRLGFTEKDYAGRCWLMVKQGPQR